jgi:hypothetical protein
MQDSKNKTLFNLPIELINGYYLSFLAIGLLFVIVRNDLSGDLKQGLFFILMALVFGSLSLLKSATNKEEK